MLFSCRTVHTHIEIFGGEAWSRKRKGGKVKRKRRKMIEEEKKRKREK